MKLLKTILFFLVTIIAGNLYAQPDTALLRKATLDLDKALIAKDTLLLKKLADDQMIYGHSSGWLQSKKEIVADLYNGKLNYTNIQQEIIKISLHDNLATVRSKVIATSPADGKQVDLKLHILQVWIWKNNTWLLVERQSTKI